MKWVHFWIPVNTLKRLPTIFLSIHVLFNESQIALLNQFVEVFMIMILNTKNIKRKVTISQSIDHFRCILLLPITSCNWFKILTKSFGIDERCSKFFIRQVLKSRHLKLMDDVTTSVGWSLVGFLIAQNKRHNLLLLVVFITYLILKLTFL